MGLDMYLKGKMYVSPYSDTELHTKLNTLTKEMGLDFPANEIVLQAAYWRKANHIHKWFVDNVQEGVDNCGEYYVSRDTLEELVVTCEDVLKDHSKAEELLPTESGFFFGSTEYDEYYYNDIKNTIKMLKPLLDSNNTKTQDLSFYYGSSW
jgi:hypothetical protein